MANLQISLSKHEDHTASISQLLLGLRERLPRPPQQSAASQLNITRNCCSWRRHRPRLSRLCGCRLGGFRSRLGCGRLLRSGSRLLGSGGGRRGLLATARRRARAALLRLRGRSRLILLCWVLLILLCRRLNLGLCLRLGLRLCRLRATWTVSVHVRTGCEER